MNFHASGWHPVPMDEVEVACLEPVPPPREIPFDTFFWRGDKGRKLDPSKPFRFVPQRFDTAYISRTCILQTLLDRNPIDRMVQLVRDGVRVGYQAIMLETDSHPSILPYDSWNYGTDQATEITSLPVGRDLPW